ncbi:MAG: hypothetical protein AAFX99_13215 [Myxococcota bacterium]
MSERFFESQPQESETTGQASLWRLLVESPGAVTQALSRVLGEVDWNV